MDILNNYITSLSHCTRSLTIAMLAVLCTFFIVESSFAQQPIINSNLSQISYTSLGNYQKETLQTQLRYQSLAQIRNLSVYDGGNLTKYERRYLLSENYRKKTILLTSALILSSFSFDIYLRSAAKKQRYNSLDWYLDRTNTIGEYQIVLKTIGSTLAAGLLLQNKKLQQTSLNSIRSIVVTKPISDLSKRLFGRSRPKEERGNMNFNPSRSGTDPNYRAYISGHTSTAWALVTPYAEAYSRWLYILPLSTTVARLYLDRHWVSDVVAGAAVGFFAGYTAHHGSRYNIRLTGNGLIFQF